MNALAFTAIAVLLVAGVLAYAVTHPRQETTMPESRPKVAAAESINASCEIGPAPPRPRRFMLQRDVDVSGVSGTGFVAEGIVFSDDTTVIRWVAGDHHSTVFWPHIDDVEAIHGHGGATQIVWIDAACRTCGCTDDEGCFPGCYWVEPDLCSACVGPAPERPAPLPDPVVPTNG